MSLKKLTIATALFAFVALPLIVDAQLSPKRILEKAYGGALPFYQSVNVGKFLKTTAKGNRKALIIGSEPQIYYYSGMKAPSSFFYYYPIQQETKMKPGIRSTFLRDISLQVPDYLIFVNSFTSHFIQSPSADEFYRQIRSFFTEYKLIGVSRYDIEKIVTDPAPLHDKSFVLAPGALLIFERNGLSSGQDGPALSSFIINKPR